MNCISCDVSCVSCALASGCIQCLANRVPMSAPYQMLCGCPNTTSVLGVAHPSNITWYCTTCTEAVLNVTFSSDYQSILVVFDDNITFSSYTGTPSTASSSLCVYLIDSTTLSTLGSGCTCATISATQFNYFTIYLGRQPTIQINDTIILKANTIIRVNCSTQAFQYYYLAQVALSPYSLSPSVTLSVPSSVVTLCQSVTITVTNIYNDGLRGLQKYNWALVSTNASDTSLIQQVLTTLNQRSQNTLAIPMLTLKAFSSYTFNLTFINFAYKSGIATFSFTTSSTGGIYVKIEQQAPLTLKNYYSNEIDSVFYAQDCSTGVSVTIASQLLVTWYNITNSLAPTILSSYISASSATSSSYTIPAYSGYGGGSYTIQITVSNTTSSQITASTQLTYSLAVSPLFVVVQGGSRICSSSSQLVLNGTALDPDISPAAQASDTINVSWTCVMGTSNSTCTDTQQNSLSSLNTTNVLTFAAHTFFGNSSYIFTFFASKPSNGKTAQQQVNITMVDDVLPSFSVSLPSSILNSKINLNVNIQATITYSGDADTITISLYLVYNSVYVAQQTFSYTTFTFQVWDLYNQFDDSQPSLTLLFVLHDPLYTVNQQASYTITLNFPPEPGTLTVSPTSGTSLQSTFTITLDSWYDEDVPLTYCYQFYLQYQDYLSDILSGSSLTSSLINTLADYSTSSSLSTLLPQPIYNSSVGAYELLVIVSVSDTLGAITNITQSIVVPPAYPNTSINLDDYLLLVQDNYNSATQLANQEQVQLLNLLALDIAYFDTNSQDSCSVSGTCSGRGACNTAVTTCVCNSSSYYLDDCSANSTQYQTYISLKKSIYDTLNSLQSTISSKALQKQLLKSQTLLLERGDLSTLFTDAETTSAINSISSLISAQTSLLTSLAEQGAQNSGDGQTALTISNTNALLNQILGFLNQMIAALQASTSRRALRALATQSQETNYESIYNLTGIIASALQLTAITNGNAMSYTGSTFTLYLQKANRQLIFSALQQLNLNATNITNLTQNFDANAVSTTSVYTIIIKNFTDNPLKYESSFPYPQEVQQLVTTDLTRSDNSAQSVNLSQPFAIAFSAENVTTNSTVRQVCLSRGTSATGTTTWSNSNCQTVKGNGTTIYCLCSVFEPTTIVNDYYNEYLQAISRNLTAEGEISIFLSYPFFKSAIFIIFIVESTLIALFVCIGAKRDNRQFLQIQPDVPENFKSKIQAQSSQKLENLPEKIEKKPRAQSAHHKSSNSRKGQENVAMVKLNLKTLDIQEIPQESMHTINHSEQHGFLPDQKTLYVTKPRRLKPLQEVPKINEDEQVQQNPLDLRNLSQIEDVEDIPENQDDLIFEHQKRRDKNALNVVELNLNHQSVEVMEIQDQDNKVVIPDSPSHLMRRGGEKYDLPPLSTERRTEIIRNEPDNKVGHDLEMDQKVGASKLKILPTILHLLEPFSIFTVFDEQLLRAHRFVLYYCKLVVMITIAQALSVSLHAVLATFACLVCSVSLAIPQALLKALLRINSIILKIICLLMIFAILGTALYYALVKAFYIDSSLFRTWAIIYSISFVLDTFVAEPIIIIIKIILVNNYGNDKRYQGRLLKTIVGAQAFEFILKK